MMTRAEQLRVAEQQFKAAANIEARSEYIEELTDKYFGVGWRGRPDARAREKTREQALVPLFNTVTRLQKLARVA